MVSVDDKPGEVVQATEINAHDSNVTEKVSECVSNVDDKSGTDKPGEAVQATEIHAHDSDVTVKVSEGASNVDDKSGDDKPGEAVQATEIHAHEGVFNVDDKSVKGVQGNESDIVDCNATDQHSHDHEKVGEVVLNVDDNL